MKIEKTLLIFLTVAHLTLATVLVILVYWSMKMNEHRISQIVEQNRILSSALQKSGKLQNTGNIEVQGDLKIR